MTASQAVYSITYRKPEKLVELTWLPGTQGMTDQDFKDSMSAFAESALLHRARCLIIDLREFRHHPSSEAGEFRDDVIVPKYFKAGVKKIAWIWPGESGDRMTEGEGGAYENRYFGTHDEAISWLTGKG